MTEPTLYGFQYGDIVTIRTPTDPEGKRYRVIGATPDGIKLEPLLPEGVHPTNLSDAEVKALREKWREHYPDLNLGETQT